MKNKTMKVINLFNDISNNKKVPNKIKVSNYIYYYDIDESQYTRFIDDDEERPRGLLEDINLYNAYIWFNLDVEIIEDKPKKIDIIGEMKNQYSIANNYNKDNIQCIVNGFYKVINSLINKNNELTKAVNYLLEKSDNNETRK